MTILFLFLLFCLIFGQLGAVSLRPGIVVYVHEMALLLFYGCTLIRLVKGKTMVYPKLTLLLSGFIFAGILSLIVNSQRFSQEQLIISSLYLLRFIFYAGIYSVIVQRYVKVNFLLPGLYGFGIAFGVLGLAQYVLYPDLRNLFYLGWDPHYYRLVSTLLDPNFAGLVLVLTFLLGLSMMIRSKRIVWYGLLECMVLVCLYLTYSRSSYIALLLGTLSWVLIQKKWKYVLVIALTTIAVSLLSISGDDTHRLLRIDTSVARVENWQQSVSLALKQPIFGHGFNTLRYVWGKPLITDGIITKASAGVDSSVLFVFATTGIVGLLSYLFLLFRMAIIGRRMRTLPVVIAIVVHSMFINSAFYPWIMIWLWIYMGSEEIRG